MTLTLLLDLDDTLLDNDINAFLPAYLKALGKHLSSYIPPERMAKQLMNATQMMLTNNSALHSLEHAFDEAFYPAIGHSKVDLRPTLEYFYDEVFPGLQSLTRQRPEAAQVVRYAQEQGHTLVIATNPLFPQKAIYHRLRWAGLDPDHTLFSLITTYENFHFAKPKTAYITEILAHLGWPNQPVAMVGNSLEDDLVPAARLGIPVFWITDHKEPLPAGFHSLSASGGLVDVPAWLETIDQANPPQDFSTPEALLSVLKSTPAMLDTLSHQLSQQEWLQRPAAGEWSLTEILCHLRDVDREVNTTRFEKVISGKNPFLPGINTDTWAEEREYQQQNGVVALREFIEIRTCLIAQLEVLGQQDWQQPARHAIFGPTNLQELVSFVATHDRTHVQQVLTTLRNQDDQAITGQNS